jgi:UDP-N-acetyl-D-glucosamine dehydrogenase
MSGLKSKTLAVIGQGYVGLPLAMAAVAGGWSVVGVDTDELKVGQINAGSSPVEDVSNELLLHSLSSNRYRATSDFKEVSEASVVTICVPTPLDSQRRPDISILCSAASAVAPYVVEETLIVSESTSYPGTLRDVIIPIFQKLKPESTKKIYYATAPERVNPGDIDWDQRNTPRLVGSIDVESKARAIKFYETICDNVISVPSPEIAEAAKLLENTFRLINIALVNEFSKICSSAEIDVFEVIKAASTKPYGFMPFKPSIGIGGHCIPVDPMYLTWWARENGIEPTLIETADNANLQRPIYVAKRALDLVDQSIEKPRILILGVAYKSGISDVRESPASKIKEYLIQFDIEVAWHDPLVDVWEGTEAVSLEWPCDLVILATNQPGVQISKLLDKKVKILDCCNLLKEYPGVVSL